MVRRQNRVKKLVASRQLKRTCVQCDRTFYKGEVYYRERDIFEDAGFISASEFLICPRCKYHNEQWWKRFAEFQKKCVHPKKFVYTEYRYIPGEYVQEPDYDHCSLGGQIV